MRAKEAISEARPPKASHRAVGSAPDNVVLFEMANLSAGKTGVDGVIYIPTSRASHAPRVKWYPARPADNAPCLSVTIEASPQAFNHRLAKRVFDAASVQVRVWVALNASSLLDFWNRGTSWMDDEVADFKTALKPLPRRV